MTAKLDSAQEPAPATAPQPTQRPGMMMQQYFSQPVPVTQLQQPAAQAGAADKPPSSQLPVLQQQAAQQPPVQQEMQAPTQQGAPPCGLRDCYLHPTVHRFRVRTSHIVQKCQGSSLGAISEVC